MKNIERLCGKDIEIVRISKGVPDPVPSPYNTEFFKGIKKIITDNFGDIPVLPSLLTGASDLRYFRSLGIPSYGFFPAVCSKDEVMRMHGKNERISIKNFYDAIDRTYDIVEFLSTCKI